MGVTQLWQILGPVECHQPLSSLQGLTLAVDLSIWVCETQAVKQMQGIVSKPFLRNLFFRISHLTQNGVKLVFVIEGSAPELKWETMMKRQQLRFPGRQGKQSMPRPQAGKQSRKNFNACLKECCELLDILGIPYIQSRGEAEALCALLNASGLVDGCLTNDGDAFLYGARVVYRNFTMNTKDPHVETYRMSDIEDKLGLDRSALIGLALLLGCDFVPKGVPGIGMANAVKLSQTLRGRDVLGRLKTWRSISESDCLDQVEVLARRKALSVPDFPQVKVIQEFQVMKDRCPTSLSPWKRPVPAKLQEFACVKLEWPVEYTLEKVLPLVTLWDMLDLLHSRNPSTHQHLKPYCIVKSRVRQGIPCYEVQWHKPVTESLHTEDFYMTVETQELFSKCYPEVVTAFHEKQTQKNVKKPSKGKKKTGTKTKDSEPSVDNLSFNFEKMNMDEVNHNLIESAKDLRPAYNEPSSGWQLVTKAKHSKHSSKHIQAVSNIEKEVTNDKRRSTMSDHSPGDGVCLHEATGMMYSNKKQIVNLTDDYTVASPKRSAIEITQPGSPMHGLKNGMKSQDDTPVVDSIVTPLSQRAKRRLRKKQRDKENARLEMLKKSNPAGLVDIASTASFSKSGGDYTLSHPPHIISNGHYFTNPYSGNSNQFKMSYSSNSLGNSSSFHSANPVGSGCGTSSPASNTFCTPRTFLKQSGSGHSSMFDSPIPNGSHHEATDSLANFRFIDTPDIEQKIHNLCDTFDKKLLKCSKSSSESTKPVFSSSSGDNSHRRDSVNGAFNAHQFRRQSNQRTDFNGSSQNMQASKSQAVLSHPSTPATTSVKANTINSTPRLSDAQDTDSHFGNFSLQSSMMNTLCASLIQAMTPKGVSIEEYEHLRATLQKIQNQQMNVGNENDLEFLEESCDIVDLSDIEKASSTIRNPFGNGVDLKPINLCTPKEAPEDKGSVKMTKTAKKKLKKASKLMREEMTHGKDGKHAKVTENRQLFVDKKANSANGKPNQGPNNVKSRIDNGNSVSSCEIRRVSGSRQGRVCSFNDSLNMSGNLKSARNASGTKTLHPEENIKTTLKNDSNAANKARLHQDAMDSNTKTKSKRKKKKKSEKNDSCFYQTFEELLRDSSELKENTISNVVAEIDEKTTKSSVSAADESELSQKKKKRKKKKIKKASSAMDLSADDSVLAEGSKVCDEYLVKALHAAREQPPDPGRQSLSASDNSLTDDALLELEALSFQLAGTSVSLTGRERLKLAARKVVKSKLVDQTEREDRDEDSKPYQDQIKKEDSNSNASNLRNNGIEVSREEIVEEKTCLLALPTQAKDSIVDIDEIKMHESVGNEMDNTSGLQTNGHCNRLSHVDYRRDTNESKDEADTQNSNINERNGGMHLYEEQDIPANVSCSKSDGCDDDDDKNFMSNNGKMTGLTPSTVTNGMDSEVQQCKLNELTNSQLMTCKNCGKNEWLQNKKGETHDKQNHTKDCMIINEGNVDEGIETFSKSHGLLTREGGQSEMFPPRDESYALLDNQTNGVPKNVKVKNGSCSNRNNDISHSNGVYKAHIDENGQYHLETSTQAGSRQNGSRSEDPMVRNGNWTHKVEGIILNKTQLNGAHGRVLSEDTHLENGQFGIDMDSWEGMESNNEACGGIPVSGIDFHHGQNTEHNLSVSTEKFKSETSVQNGHRKHDVKEPIKKLEAPTSTATPKSLIDRLKLKLKKASTRKVLKSFTEKEKTTE